MFSITETGKKVFDHYLDVFVPPKPNRITRKIYLCGKTFQTQCIEHLFIPHDQQQKFGLIVVHGESAKIVVFTTGGFDVVQNINEELASRHNKGGQSQNRHQRNHDIMVNVFNDMVSNAVKDSYLDQGQPIIEGIIVVGTGEKRFSVVKKLPVCLQRLIFCDMTVPSKDVTVFDFLKQHKYGLIQMFNIEHEKNIYSEFTKHIDTDTGKAVYGPKDVNKQLIGGMLKKIIIHQSLMDKKGDKIRKIAKKVGCEISIIGRYGDGQCGHALLHDFGGVVGIKWY